MPPDPLKIIAGLRKIFGQKPIFEDREVGLPPVQPRTDLEPGQLGGTVQDPVQRTEIGKQGNPIGLAIADFLTGLGSGVPAAQAQQQQRAQRITGIRQRSLQRSQLENQADQQEFNRKISLAGVLSSTLEGGVIDLPGGRSLTIPGQKRKAESDPNRFFISNDGRGGLNIVDRTKGQNDVGFFTNLSSDSKGGFNQFFSAVSQGMEKPFTPNEKSVMGVAFRSGGPESALREFNRITDRRKKAGKKTDVEQLATWTAEDRLRTSYLTELDDLPQIIGSFVRVNTFAKMDNKELRTAQSDLAMVFAFMKMLDPGSVVRESEFATAAQAGGIPESLLRTWNNLQQLARENPNARGLTDNQVDRMFKEAENLFKVESLRKDAFDERFRGIANRRNLDPRNIINETLFEIPGDGEGGNRKFSVNSDGSVTEQ